MKKVILDVDTGVDDAWAILLALRSPELSVQGITTVAGNVDCDLTTKNTLRILELAGHTEIPVAQGLSKPIMGDLQTGKIAHGDDGIGNVNLPEPKGKPVNQHAVDFLIERIMAAPGEIALLPVGPLSNIATALLQEPRLAGAVREAIIMGGAVTVTGNRTPSAEFNIYTDPEAARIVFSSGMPITLVGLDVTRQTLLRQQHLDYLRKLADPVAQFVARSARVYLEFARQRFGRDGCALHDPLTVGVAIDRSLVKTRNLFVGIETRGEFTRGATVGDLYGTTKLPPNAAVCLEADIERFVDLFVKRISLAI